MRTVCVVVDPYRRECYLKLLLESKLRSEAFNLLRTTSNYTSSPSVVRSCRYTVVPSMVFTATKKLYPYVLQKNPLAEDADRNWTTSTHSQMNSPSLHLGNRACPCITVPPTLSTAIGNPGHIEELSLFAKSKTTQDKTKRYTLLSAVQRGP